MLTEVLWEGFCIVHSLYDENTLLGGGCREIASGVGVCPRDGSLALYGSLGTEPGGALSLGV